MKNYLSLAGFENRWPNNPTQLALRRFEKMPWGEMRSAFTDAQDAFGARLNDALKTRYDKFWKDGGDD